MAEYIKFQNIQNPKLTGICTLAEFEAMNDIQAVRGKFRIIERNLNATQKTKSVFQNNAEMKKKHTPEPPEVAEAKANVKAKTKRRTRRKKTTEDKA